MKGLLRPAKDRKTITGKSLPMAQATVNTHNLDSSDVGLGVNVGQQEDQVEQRRKYSMEAPGKGVGKKNLQPFYIAWR